MFKLVLHEALQYTTFITQKLLLDVKTSRTPIEEACLNKNVSCFRVLSLSIYASHVTLAQSQTKQLYNFIIRAEKAENHPETTSLKNAFFQQPVSRKTKVEYNWLYWF